MWFAARDPDSHDFAVKSGCNVMVTPLMKGDEEVADLKRKFDTAVADHPDGWCPAEGISKFYRTFDAWFGNKSTPVDGFLDPSPEFC